MVEELTLKIPWSSLKNKPVEIYIVGIRALASMEENVKVGIKYEYRIKQHLGQYNVVLEQLLTVFIVAIRS